jgi:hypothetical protein
MSGPTQVPMAVAGCGLDYQKLGGQLDRYSRLSRSVIALEQHAQRLEVSFSSAIDEQLLTQAVAVERSCCAFLTLDYDPSKRRLSISAEDTAGADALAAIRSALTAALEPTSRR